MGNLKRMVGSVVVGGFVFLTGLPHAFAYESGELMCQALDEDPDDGIDFICKTRQNVTIADGYVAGRSDAAEFRLRVTEGAGGEQCNGTVNCNIEFDTAVFYDVPPGGYLTYIPFPNQVYVNCSCR